MVGEERRHILAAMVEHKPGVLFKVVNMFRRRGFNIDSISVGVLDDGKTARMTIVVKGDEKVFEQVVKQLHKIIEVVKVSSLDFGSSVVRELALIKVHTPDSKAKSDLIQLVDVFRGRIVDVSLDSMIVEITGDPDKVEAFVNLAKTHGIKELARTGLTALARGARVLWGAG